MAILIRSALDGLRPRPVSPGTPLSMPSTFALLVGGAGCLGSLIWVAMLGHLARHRDQAVFLADLDDSEPPGGWPAVAMIFAARDEAAMVGPAARSMLGQDYPALEVIAVDDRSVDATGAILDGLAAEAGGARLRVVHVRDLPAGWLGKTHALQRATEATEASWLLFTDADVLFRPGALRRAIRFAEAEGLDHVALLPEMPNQSVSEKMFLAIFGLLFGIACPLGRLARRDSRAHMGIGAFNLVRAEVLRDIGGFHRLALSVDDDMMLAKALKFAGYRMRPLLGARAVSVVWQVGLGGMVGGLEKNFFAALRFRLPLVAVAISGITCLGIAPFAGLWVGPWPTRAACALGVATVALLLAETRSHSGIGWPYAVLLPVASLVLIFTLIRSTVLTLSRGGVVWRGHLYPIGELKAHTRLRDAWLREVWLSTR